MAQYHKLGSLPPKRHTQFRKPNQELQVMIEFLSHLSQLKRASKSGIKVPTVKNGRQLSVVLVLFLLF